MRLEPEMPGPGSMLSVDAQHPPANLPDRELDPEVARPGLGEVRTVVSLRICPVDALRGCLQDHALAVDHPGVCEPAIATAIEASVAEGQPGPQFESGVCSHQVDAIPMTVVTGHRMESGALGSVELAFQRQPLALGQVEPRGIADE